MTEGRVETESRCQECLAIIKGEVTSNNLSKCRVRTRTHGVVGGRGGESPPPTRFRFKVYTIAESRLLWIFKWRKYENQNTPIRAHDQDL